MNKGMFLGGTLFKAERLLFSKESPLNFKNEKEDHLYLKKAKKVKKIKYHKPDNKLSFDRVSSLPFSGTNHRDNQPVHLLLSNKETPLRVNIPLFRGPETRYCPAAVYEYISPTGQPTNDISLVKSLEINGQNCLHCKACDIKDPSGNINWITPEGGGGPNYERM
jgi:electron-transferring-flavoprotein dehydrogenase